MNSEQITTDEQIKNGEEKWKSYMRRGILLVLTVAVSVLILFLVYFAIDLMQNDGEFRKQVAESLIDGIPGISAALLLIFGFKAYGK